MRVAERPLTVREARLHAAVSRFSISNETGFGEAEAPEAGSLLEEIPRIAEMAGLPPEIACLDPVALHSSAMWVNPSELWG